MQHLIKTVLTFSLVMALGLNPVAAADQVLELEWEDLVPESSAPLVNPVDAIDPDLVPSLAELNILRLDDSELSDPDLAEMRKEAQARAGQTRQELTDRGINIDDFFDQYDTWEAAIDKLQKGLVTEHDGKQVKIPGYLLPLEFSDEGSKEFLLVPYVGACIHTPPPPPTQMIFVETTEPYKLTDLYDPVYVIGQMKTAQLSKRLHLVDGSQTVDVGYTIDSKAIKTYSIP